MSGDLRGGDLPRPNNSPSKWERLKSWGRRRQQIQLQPEPAGVVPVEPPSIPKSLGIATILAEKLQGRDITPPEFRQESTTAPAIIKTNETITEGFFEAVQEKQPDGYIVGVGVSNALTMVNCFPEGTPPKGIVIVDVDPRVIAVGKLVVRNLAEAKTADEFRSRTLGLSESAFNAAIHWMIDEEENPILKERLKRVWHSGWVQAYKYLDHTQVRPHRINGFPFRENDNKIDVASVIDDQFALLHGMAESGNIALVYGDFTNADLIEGVSSLPDFTSSRNIIYLSNIVDHITNEGEDFAKLNQMDMLFGYAFGKQPIFIDTLRSMGYALRVSTELNFPNAAEDLQVSIPGRMMIQMGRRPFAKPEGLIFPEEHRETLPVHKLTSDELHSRAKGILVSESYQAFRKEWLDSHPGLPLEVLIPDEATIMAAHRSLDINSPAYQDRYAFQGVRGTYVSRYSEQTVQLMEIYNQAVRRIKSEKGIDMKGKPLSEALEAL